MDKNFVSVAIIIVNWNSGAWLKKCLLGIAAQTVQPRQVILVDNASTDRSLDGIEEILPRIQILRETENIGFAKANNIAFESIKELRWTVLLNPDAIPHYHWLETLMDAVKAYPEYDFFSCKMVDALDPSKLDGTGDAYHTSGRAWRKGFGCNIPQGGETAEDCFSPCAAAAMYRTDIIQQANGFDERFFCYFEDVDLGFRLRLLGYRCLYVPEAVVAHVGSASTGKGSDFSAYYGHRNMVWTYFKNMPWPLFWTYLPQHILVNIAGILILLFRGQGRIVLQAKYDALGNLFSIWQDRKKIQRTRQISALHLRRIMSKGFCELIKGL